MARRHQSTSAPQLRQQALLLDLKEVKKEMDADPTNFDVNRILQTRPYSPLHMNNE